MCSSDLCGLGRTGSRWACQQDGVAPELLVVAKGLAAGYQPISATLVSEKIYDAISRTRGHFQHGHSYQAHAVACATALAVQRVIREQNLISNVRSQGEMLMRLLRERFGRHPHVGDIRGRGLFWALEFVADRTTKTPFDPGFRVYDRVKSAAYDLGLAIYPMGGTIDGKHGDHIITAPPYNVTATEIDTIVARLGDAVDNALLGIESPNP